MAANTLVKEINRHFMPKIKRFSGFYYLSGNLLSKSKGPDRLVLMIVMVLVLVFLNHFSEFFFRNWLVFSRNLAFQYFK